jgi:phage-related protein
MARRPPREASGAFRVICVAHFEVAIYVLHAFQKKTQKTSQTDIDLARGRLRAIEEER